MTLKQRLKKFCSARMKALSTEWCGMKTMRVLKSRPETFPDKRNRVFMVIIHERDFSQLLIKWELDIYRALFFLVYDYEMRLWLILFIVKYEVSNS